MDRVTPQLMSDAWDVLDRFIQQLQDCGRSSGQFRLLLETIADSIGADSVFLHSDESPDHVDAAGRQLDAEWRRALTQRILEDSPGVSTHIIRSDLDGMAGDGPKPASAALVQVSKSKSAWVVALSFSPERIFQRSDVKVMMLARRLLSYHYHQLFASEELKETLFGLIYCLTTTIDAKDPYTCGHSERVARMAVRLARQMNMPADAVSDIYLAGLLHDIGKIGIKDSVLQKSGKLTYEEMRHVQEHPVIGDRIISSVKRLSHLRPGVRNHHERYDGQGYPDRLAGENIPLVARILAVADSCDAMMSPRPYRRALPTRQIDAIMVAGAGTQWDPKIVEHFMACRQELYSICEQGLGESLYAAVENAVRPAHHTSSDLAVGPFNGRVPAAAVHPA
jgi:HD-GYP domain-containing protein (c-di-GMP phosphodiesterase class II)